MSLLPKSIHRCRRYPTKFNSGRDIPELSTSEAIGQRHLEPAPLRVVREAVVRLLDVGPWRQSAGQVQRIESDVEPVPSCAKTQPF